MTMSRRTRWLAAICIAVASGASACSGNSSAIDPAANPDGKIAPGSATMKWEQTIPAATEPEHVLRRYSAPMSPGRVREFYLDELKRRGWDETPSRDLSYAEWSRDGMQILLVFEPPSAQGSEWTLALFAAD